MFFVSRGRQVMVCVGMVAWVFEVSGLIIMQRRSSLSLSLALALSLSLSLSLSCMYVCIYNI